MKYFKKLTQILLITLLAVFISIVLLAYLTPLPTTKYSDTDNTNMISEYGKYIDIDNYSGYYIDINENYENTIVLIHGLGASTQNWTKLINYLQNQEIRIIAIDLKGFGLSQKTLDTDYSHNAQAIYVKNVLDKIGINQAIFVGHSMGGSILMHYYYLFPNMVSKIILIAPAININSNQLTKLIGIPPLDRIARQIILRTTDKKLIENITISAYSPTKPEQTSIDSYYFPTTIKDWELSLIGIIRDSSKNNIDLSQLNDVISVYVIIGEKDNWISKDQSTLVTKYFTNYKLYEIEQGSHVPQETDIDKLVVIFEEIL
jgi:pimeloyl-ACP methyl ester carboxylesterase